MIYPNIQVIDSTSNVYFANKNQDPVATKGHFYLHYLLKKNSSDVGIVFMSQPIEDITNLTKYIKEKNYPHILFIIDDVFRESIFRVGSAGFDRDFSNADFEELDIVGELINECNIKSFKVYHCENLKEYNLNKKYKFEIEHLDIYLSNFIYNKKQWACCSTITKKFDKKISCLSNRFDYHRALINAFLLNEEEALCTYNDTINPASDISMLDIVLESFESPYKEVLTTNLYKLHDKFKNTDILSSDKQHSCFSYDLINRSFLNIIAETTYMTPYQYISEKSIKPMMVARPFVMLGPVNNLKMLKSLGFKTFSKWWDESYDEEPNNTKRLIKVYEIVNSILNTPYTELESMLDEMIPILDFNRKHIKNIPEQFYSKFLAAI